MSKPVLCAVVVALCFVFAPCAIAHTNPTPDQLVDELAQIDCPLPGVSATGNFDGFLAEDDAATHFSGGLLVVQNGRWGYPAPCRNATVASIVRIGPEALPALIRHIDDKRPTKLNVGGDSDFGDVAIVFGNFFSDEYDARHETWPLDKCTPYPACKESRPFDKSYNVKVGDICFVLIGQIVNRQLNAVRYQPTAMVIVNSPVETPDLAERVRADWSGVDGEGVKNSLLADLHVTKIQGAPDAETEAQALAFLHSGALRRLRHYFPDVYSSLTGPDLEERNAFEKAERDSP